MWSSRGKTTCLVISVLLLTLWAGLLPYLDLWDHFPRGADANTWVSASNLDNQAWFTWVFSSRHFVGYRPVAAGSFTLNSLLTGWQPWGYRLTDMTLHVTAGLSVFGLWATVAPKSKPWGLLALLICFAHPASENVVPHLARRSYLLASVFSTTAVICWIRAVRAPHGARWLGLSGVLLSAAVLSNEVAVVTAVWMPLVALLWPQDTRTRLKQSLVPAGILLAAIAMRIYFLGHMGGYKKHYFAHARRGQNVLREMDPVEPFSIVFASVRYLVNPTSASGDVAWWSTVPGGSLFIGFAALCMVVVAIASIVRLRQRQDALPALLLMWIGGSVALFVISGNWFWRLGYAMLPPYALLLAWMAREFAARGALSRTVGLPLIGVLLWALLANSPALRGLDHGALKGQFKANDLIYALNIEIKQVQEPATVWLALSTTTANSHTVLKWVKRLHPSVHFRLMATSTSPQATPIGSPVLSLEDIHSRPKITLHSDMTWRDIPDRSSKHQKSKRLWLDKLHIEGQNGYLAHPNKTGITLTVVPPLPDDLRDEAR
ncbi:MAG: hypothetical protein GWP91_14055 [Rhodobacterales bacterium]|nr:hypothetical protein [Rhodobacterales bacterium]